MDPLGKAPFDHGAQRSEIIVRNPKKKVKERSNDERALLKNGKHGLCRLHIRPVYRPDKEGHPPASSKGNQKPNPGGQSPSRKLWWQVVMKASLNLWRHHLDIMPFLCVH